MFKALLKKQLMEMFQGITLNRRTGKRRQGFGLIGFLLIFVLAFASLGFFFYTNAEPLAQSFIASGRGWLYFAVMGLAAMVMGIFLSVFSTYSALYKAKDNEMLLSMPLPPRTILLARIAGVYFTTLIYQAIVWLPAVFAAWVQKAPEALPAVLQIALLPVLGLLSVSLSSLLGWLVALASSRIAVKNKSFATMLFTIVFLALYYVFYFRLEEILQDLISNADQVAGSIRAKGYPLYLLGTASDGNLTSFLLLTLAIAAAFALCVWLLSRGFIGITTGKRSAKKTVYKERRLTSSSLGKALFKKELARFTSSSTYMLNCGMGALFMVAAAVFVMIKAGGLREALTNTFGGSIGMNFIFVVAAALVCLFSAMNYITAPSVSLEGRTLWIAQSLPVRGIDALKAKLKLHLVMTCPPTALLVLAVCFALRADVLTVLTMLLYTSSFVLLMGCLGLFIDLKRPNIHWTNEAYPLKQSLNIFIIMFGGWIAAALTALPYLLLAGFMGAPLYMLIAAAVCSALSALLLRWLSRKGAAIYSHL